MLSYEFYKVMHLTALFMIFSGIGAQILHYYNGGDKNHKGRKLVGIMHGVGLLLALVAGFGLLARIGTGMQGWVVVKLVVWIALGGISFIAIRKPKLGPIVWVIVIALGLVGAVLARYKPF